MPARQSLRQERSKERTVRRDETMKRRPGQANGDAFALLMSHGKRPKPSNIAVNSSRSSRKTSGKSQFVLCPAGCGKHVLERAMNSHLDACFRRQNEATNAAQADVDVEEQRQPSTPPPSSSEREEAVTIDIKDSGNEDGDKDSQSATNDTAATTPITSSTAPTGATSTEKDAAAPTKSAFAIMMKQAKHAFAPPPQKRRVFHRLHLNADCEVTLTTTGTELSLEPTDCVWRDCVTLRLPTANIHLWMTSSMPHKPSPQQRRLVQRHSRFSIPALKSILQKNIRRRRPLPSVRVAMELLDRQPEQLYRRLPIIILEDSTLHPDMAILVWCMMAHSKGYFTTSQPRLQRKMLQIVYDVASCPWQDSCSQGSNGDNDTPTLLTIAPSHINLYACLVRVEYGGMAHDLSMMRRFVQTWQERTTAAVPQVLHAELPPAQSGIEIALLWHDVPCVAHRRSRGRWIPECIPKLGRTDVALQGIDFHCSSILGMLRGDGELMRVCRDRILQSAVAMREGTEPKSEATSDEDQEVDQEYVVSVIRKLMWTYSAGVNHRQPLLDEVKERAADENDAAAKLKSLWNEVLAQRITSLSKRFVEERLAR